MKLKMTNKLQRKKEGNWIGIWSQLKVVKVESKEKNEGSNKEELKNHMMQFHMIMQKFRIAVRNGPKEGFVLQTKKNLQVDFAQSCEMVQEANEIAITPLILHNHAKLVFFMQNGYLLINSKLLNGEASKKSLK